MGQLVDDGWGNLIPIESSGFIFSDFSGNYTDYLGNIIDPSTYNPISDDGWGNYNNGFTDTQKTDIKTTYEEAKKSGDAKLEKIMGYVFKYGKVALDLLVSTGVIKNANSRITKDNVDTDKYDSSVNEIQKTVSSKSTGSTNTPQSNSTYFGIDFSSPIVWLIIIVIVIFFFAFNSSSKPQQVYIPQQQPSRR